MRAAVAACARTEQRRRQGGTTRGVGEARRRGRKDRRRWAHWPAWGCGRGMGGREGEGEGLGVLFQQL